MRDARIALALLMLLAAPAALSQPAGGAPTAKLFCWKNKAGKTECGDKVPYEYQDAAVKELNKQGVVTRQTESVTPEQRKAQEEAQAKKQVEDQRREDMRRKDKALLDTFTTEKEIDLKRVRDVQLIESTIETLQTNLKNMIERRADTQSRINQYVKEKRPVPQPFQDEIEHLDSEKAQSEKLIAQKRNEIILLNQKYDELKKRFAELTAGTTGSTRKSGSQTAGSEQKSR
jgi:chromosome segregation ATPase